MSLVVGHGTSACSTVAQDDMIRSHSETGSALSRSNINDLVAFVAVARARSFTKAAAKMGLSQSALSHTVRQLETRLGVRLLTRTTRAVSPTEAGERLLKNIGPHFDEIELQVNALNDLREKPAGTIRIVAADVAIQYVLYPKLKKVLQKYPDIKVELIRDHGLSDIVTCGFWVQPEATSGRTIRCRPDPNKHSSSWQAPANPASGPSSAIIRAPSPPRKHSMTGQPNGRI